MIVAAAWFFAALSLGVAAFQVALALGAPWGEWTLGGRYRGALPPRVRGVPVVSAVLLASFAAVVLSRAGVAFPALAGVSDTAVWAVVAYCALGTVANAITPSRRERALWLPVVVGMLASSLRVALA